MNRYRNSETYKGGGQRGTQEDRNLGKGKRQSDRDRDSRHINMDTQAKTFTQSQCLVGIRRRSQMRLAEKVRQSHRYAKINGQAGTDTHRHIDRHSKAYLERGTDRQTRPLGTHTEATRQTFGGVYIQRDRHTNTSIRHTQRHTDRHSDSYTDRGTDRRTRPLGRCMRAMETWRKG